MLSPMEAIAEKPTPRDAAHSTSPAAMAPDCEISARSPGSGKRRREAGIEFGVRRQHAEAIGTDQAHPGVTGSLLALFGERAGPVAKPGGDDDAGCCALARGRGNRVRHRRRRHGDDHKVGRFGQRVVGIDGGMPSISS